MTESVGSAQAHNGSLVVGAQTTETPESAVRVSPSPAWRAIDDLQAGQFVHSPSEAPGARLTPTIGRIVQEPAALIYHH